MRFETYTRDDVTVIALDGTVDTVTAAEARSGLAHLMPDNGRLLLDLEKVPRLSGAALRVLLLMYHRARRNGIPMALAQVPREAHDTPSTARFLDTLPVADTVDAGVRVLSR